MSIIKWIAILFLLSYPLYKRWHVIERWGYSTKIDHPRLEGLRLNANESKLIEFLVEFDKQHKNESILVFPIPNIFYYITDRIPPTFATVFSIGFEYWPFDPYYDEHRVINEIENKKIDYILIPQLANDIIYEGMPLRKDIDFKSVPIGNETAWHHDYFKLYVMGKYKEISNNNGFWVFKRNQFVEVKTYKTVLLQGFEDLENDKYQLLDNRIHCNVLLIAKNN